MIRCREIQKLHDLGFGFKSFQDTNHQLNRAVLGFINLHPSADLIFDVDCIGDVDKTCFGILAHEIGRDLRHCGDRYDLVLDFPQETGVLQKLECGFSVDGLLGIGYGDFLNIRIIQILDRRQVDILGVCQHQDALPELLEIGEFQAGGFQE